MNDEVNKKSQKKNVKKGQGKQKKKGNKKVKNNDSRPNKAQQDKGKFKNKAPIVKAADSSIASIQIDCFMNNQSFNSFPLGLISQVALKAQDLGVPVYGCYAALIYDFIQVTSGAMDSLKQRPRYLNDLYGSFRPKTIVTKTDDISFRWDGPGGSFPPPNTFSIRGHSYYFCETVSADNNLSQPQQMQLINNAITQADANSYYGTLISLVSEESDCLELINSDIPSPYIRDISAFAQSAVYWGGGSGPAGGPYSSIEAEMPFKIGVTMGYFCQFGAIPNNRVAKFLKPGAGDACAAFAYPFLDKFTLKNYRTVYPTKFKFIDFAEIYLTAVSWMASSLTKTNDIAGNVAFYTPIELGAFLGALRQTIVKMFFDSQCIGQFQTYDPLNVFEGFRLGMNCVPRIDETLRLPLGLVENLRMLLPQIYERPSEKYHNDRNCIIYVPVIGMDPVDTVWDIPTYNDAGITKLLFTTGPYDGVSLIDGTLGGNIYNFNSKYYQAAITAWNQTVGNVSAYCGTVASASGSPPKGSLLTYTRYVNATEVNFEELKTLPTWCPLPLGLSKKEIIRTKSQKKMETGQEYEIVGGSSNLVGEVTVYVSSVCQFTADMASILPSLILPKIRIATDGTSSVAVGKFQTTYRESYTLREMVGDNTTFNPNNRASNIINISNSMATGIAKEASTELDKVLNYMTEVGKGGFIADILNGLGYIAGGFGL